MTWIFYGILAFLSFGLYNFFVKIAADKINPMFAVVILTFTAFLVSLVTLIAFRLSGQKIVYEKNAIYMAILAGVSTGLAEIFYFLMYSKGATLTFGNSFVVGGTILVATFLGIVVLKEPIISIKIMGIALVFIGLILLSKN